MDFPPFTPDTRDDSRPTEAITVTAPAFDPNDTRSAEERWLDQQWRDVHTKQLDAEHPLSLNRDSAYVTNDPYTTTV